MFLRSAKAKALAGIGDLDQAQQLMDQAVVLANETEAINLQGDIQVDAAEVFTAAGWTSEAKAALENAFALFERKGNIVARDRAGARLQSLHVGNT